MATYNNININNIEDTTPNYKFALMGEDYQTSSIIYRANLERLAFLLNSLIQDAIITPPSGEKKIQAVTAITENDYDTFEDGKLRTLYLIKEE